MDENEIGAWGIAAGSIQNTMNAIAQGNINKDTRKWNEKIMNTQRGWAKEDWDRQNEYNSPIETMKRLKAGGLNPNLVYGNGATTQAQAIRSSGAEGWNPQAPSIDMGFVMQSLSQIYDLTRTTAQTNNLQAQVDLLEEQTRLTDINRRNREWDLGYKEESQDYNLETLQQRNRNLFKDEMLKDQALDINISKNERENALAENTIEQGVKRILLMRQELETAPIKRALIQKQIDNLDKDMELKQADIDLRKTGALKNEGPLQYATRKIAGITDYFKRIANFRPGPR